MLYKLYKAACTSSLIQTDRRMDTGRDIVASAMKQIATTNNNPLFQGFQNKPVATGVLLPTLSFTAGYLSGKQ